ncbi:hypothetical protein J2X69_003847 [Algoriphagus sp. 4150]|uniref:retropepsin-like aspartic protease n=1 Tax=Algoriphagus sp. 4150 TaxID=2817756 RepID=UPI002861A578|nr:retropepsin-like aspartic protease [Algoriphagus sp. 4150]MDR7131483.1 hypothetical protein [Algoriphagus sp. 4150]
MKYWLVSFLLISIGIGCSPQNQDQIFEEILSLCYEKDFFSASEIYGVRESELTPLHRNMLTAILANAFNRTERSEKSLVEVLDAENPEIHDSLRLKLLEVRLDNAYKSFNYLKAKETATRIIEDFGVLLSTEELDNYENSLKIWSILENQPVQQSILQGPVIQQMTKDPAGLNNLIIRSEKDSIPMIFDTGANLSTITRSGAHKLNMKILEDSIQVGTITGAMVYANLAVSGKIKLGTAIFENVVFLVLSDEHLAFPQIDYQIHGILGYPVMESLRRISIGKDGSFVAADNSQGEDIYLKSNMAMDRLSVLIQLDGKHFYLDTGADETMLYQRYFRQNKEQIEAEFPLEQIQFGGAGGHTELPGHHIDFRIEVNGQVLHFPKTAVLKEIPNEKWTHVYGNIGQDLIAKFDRMTLDFENMTINFL